jgi:hypothetical protein
MAYRCVATSVAGFVQQLAVAYVTHGYYFYVTGVIPKHKDATATDQKIIGQYGIDVSKWTRVRQKKAGVANVQYLRCGRFFVIIATHGRHAFFEAEGGKIRDIRKHPLRFQSYSVGCRRARGGGGHHASARISRECFAGLKSRFQSAAIRNTLEELCADLHSLPFEPYAPIRDQLRALVRVINRQRKLAGLELVPVSALRLRRSPVRPFDQENSGSGSIPFRLEGATDMSEECNRA